MGPLRRCDARAALAASATHIDRKDSIAAPTLLTCRLGRRRSDAGPEGAVAGHPQAGLDLLEIHLTILRLPRPVVMWWPVRLRRDGRRGALR